MNANQMTRVSRKIDKEVLIDSIAELERDCEAMQNRL